MTKNILIRCSDFICITFASSVDQMFRLRLLHIRRSDFVFCISGVQTSPSYGSDVQTSSASHSLAQQIRRSDFVFCILGVQTSPSYGSDIQTSSASHLLTQQIRLRLLHNRRSDFAFILIRCSDFICIFASFAKQTFRLPLLHIRRSDFASIWIRCSDFICITFASTAGQTFRLRLLHIRRSDFTLIWIRCSDFICITFASTADQTSSSAYQAFRLRLHIDQMFRLHLHHIC